MNEENKNEDRIQSDCFQWSWNNYPSRRRRCFHINNKSRNKIEGAKMKAMGVVKGPSDLALIADNGQMVWVEMKTPIGRQREEQKDFQQKVEAVGHIYLMERTFEGFQAIVRYYWGPEEIKN